MLEQIQRLRSIWNNFSSESFFFSHFDSMYRLYFSEIPAYKSFVFESIHIFRDVLNPSSRHFRCLLQILDFVTRFQEGYKHRTSFLLLWEMDPINNIWSSIFVEILVRTKGNELLEITIWIHIFENKNKLSYVIQINCAVQLINEYSP